MLYGGGGGVATKDVEFKDMSLVNNNHQTSSLAPSCFINAPDPTYST